MDLKAHNRRIIACRKCPRLVDYRQRVAREKRKAYSDWVYWGKPVPGFGDPKARIMAVGLAPGPHGSNRTGRMFTGDASGRFLFSALYRAGLASAPESFSRDDELTLKGLYITASCRCVPPDNKPSPEELSNCRPYLEYELHLMDPKVIVCLGRIAFQGIVRIHALRPSAFKFAHGASFEVPKGDGRGNRWLLCTYHPSQQNTFTGRLTPAMFDKIWLRAKTLGGLSSR